MKIKILWVLAFLPTVITAFVIQFMNDKVPMHYDINGKVDRYGSKYESFIFPAIILINALFWYLFIRYYKNKQNSSDEKEVMEAKNNEMFISYTAIGTTIMFSIMHFFFMASSIIEVKYDLIESALDISRISNICLGGLFIFLGNIMPKAKLNSSVGVRTVWSMENDETWAESNCFGGKALIVAGILTILESIFISGIASTLVMLGIIIAFAIIVTVYSQRVYKRITGKD